MASIYLDACCFIYLVEGQPEWRTVVEQRLRNLDPLSKLITSQLTRLECRTKPMREGNRALLELYETLFAADRVAVWDVSEHVIDARRICVPGTGSRHRTQFTWQPPLNFRLRSSGPAMPPYRAALTSLSRCLLPAQLDTQQSRLISMMGKSLPPKPPDDAPTVSTERALISAKLDEEMSRLRRLEAEQAEAKRALRRCAASSARSP